MKITVKVFPKAHINSVEEIDGMYIVRTTVVPESGKANARIIKLLAAHFGVAPSCVSIIKGQNSRSKIVDIML